MSDLEVITFHKEDNTPWGFRLTGGSDFEVPLHVVKVSQGSIADNGGLQVGDLLVKINDKETSGLTHIQAHDVILAAGNDFTFTIYRSDADLLREIAAQVQEDQGINVDSIKNDNNDEIQQITGKITTEMNINVQIQEEQIVNEKQEIIQSETKVVSGQVETEQNAITRVEQIEQQKQEVQVSSENITQNISENTNQIENNIDETTDNVAGFDLQDLLPEAIKHSEVLKAVTEDEIEVQKQKEQEILIKKVEEEKKWSTFLQKPSRPKPKDKKEEALEPKEPGYKMKIVKQKKKRLQADAQPAPTENPESEQQQEQNPEQLEENVEQTEMNEEQSELNQEQMVQEISERQEEQDVSLQEEQSNEPVVSEMEMSLEEQLAAVQRQLLALSQLPQAIQQTLDVVTSQLAKIVGDTQQDSHAGENEDGEDNTNNEEKDYQEDDYEPELDIIDEIPEEGEDGEFGEESQETLGELGEQAEDGRQERLGEEAQQEVPPPEPELTEEEKEARRIEEERLAKKQKDHQILEELHQRRLKERPSFPLTPLKRPIFLPGGRRWRMPGDAAPEISCSQNMPDDIIAETISAQSEIITGTTLGINFLKFEPLPVNLEHLKNSEVYKMVHDLDPAPSRGIAHRSDKPAPAASDYYNQIRNENSQQYDALTK